MFHIDVAANPQLIVRALNFDLFEALSKIFTEFGNLLFIVLVFESDYSPESPAIFVKLVDDAFLFVRWSEFNSLGGVVFFCNFALGILRQDIRAQSPC